MDKKHYTTISDMVHVNSLIKSTPKTWLKSARNDLKKHIHHVHK